MSQCIFKVGADEAGRGPLAGPVVGAAVVFPPGYLNPEITDSKQLSPKKRDKLFDEIIKSALSYSIVAVGQRRIDQINILQASLLAMRLAVLKTVTKGKIQCSSCRILIDGNMKLGSGLEEEAIVDGDAKVMEIGAASILAKVTRDRIMKDLHHRYPDYDFQNNAGYPTRLHLEKLQKMGPTYIHRKTFGPVKKVLEELSCR